MKTIVYAHPYPGSFNHAILAGVVAKFKSTATPYQVIDLYADGFNPVLSVDDLRQYNAGGTDDPLVSKYQEMLRATDDLILIFPTWWYDLPAILKGFFDKVMLPDFAYTSDADGILTGKLTHIQQTTLITTAGQQLPYFTTTKTDSLKTTFMEQILPDLGLDRTTIRRFHFGTVHQIRVASTAFLKQVVAAV